MGNKQGATPNAGEKEAAPKPTTLVTVDLLDLSGEKLTSVEIAIEQKIHDLKPLVMEQTGFHQDTQQFLHTGEILNDEDVLADLCDQTIPNEPLEFTLIRVLPYDGDVQKACLARDHAAIKFLMKERDQGKTTPAGLLTLACRTFRTDVTWSRKQEALMDYGYTQSEINEAMASVKGAKDFENLFQWLRDKVRVIEEEPEFVKWWEKKI